MKKRKLIIAAWFVTALLAGFALVSALDGRMRDATESGIASVFACGGAILVTRYW
jgi:hypothetical protein